MIMNARKCRKTKIGKECHLKNCDVTKYTEPLKIFEKLPVNKNIKEADSNRFEDIITKRIKIIVIMKIM